MGGDITCYKDFQQYVQHSLPGVPDPLLNQIVRRACRDFCQDSEAWVETLDSVNLVEGVTIYAFDWNFCATVHRIDELRITDANTIAQGLKGRPQREHLYDFNPPETIELDMSLKPAQDVTNGLELDVVLVPKMDAWPFSNDDFAQWFLNRWYEGIEARVFYLLMKMPKSKWSDPIGKLENLATYNKYLNRAKGEKSRSNKRNSSNFSA